ncbi:MAG: hypothetical protein ACPG32_15525, partial [Akkermansiaceae bacterium]
MSPLKTSALFTSLIGLVLLSSCRDDDFVVETRDNKDEVSAFYERYNKKNREETLAEIKKIKAELADAALKESDRTEKQGKLNKLLSRAKYPEMFRFATMADLPGR